MQYRKFFISFSILILLMSLFCSELFAEPVPMQVRQSAFKLEFKVYRTSDMPANWFKTYDDFFVTRRIDNNWVYGKRTSDGIKMTDILVGSVDPANVPELNEVYTNVTVGATPIYMPPLPPEMKNEINTKSTVSPVLQTEDIFGN